MTIRIGANPICWSNDDLPRIGGWISLEQCLSEARAFGIAGMELGHKFPRQPELLGPILRSYGLALVSGWYSTFLSERSATEEFRAARAHRHLLKSLGAKVLIAAECAGTVHGDIKAPLSTRPTLDRAGWTRFCKNLSAFARMVRDEDGLALVYHHHMGTVIQNGGEIDRLMDGTDDTVKLLLDTGHATWAGDSPLRLARAYRTRIKHVHCKDIRLEIKAKAETKDWSFLRAVLAGVYTVPGDGAVDFVSIFKALKDYSGWVVLEAEQDIKIAPPEKYVPLGIRNMKRFLRLAGLA